MCDISLLYCKKFYNCHHHLPTNTCSEFQVTILLLTVSHLDQTTWKWCTETILSGVSKMMYLAIWSLKKPKKTNEILCFRFQSWWSEERAHMLFAEKAEFLIQTSGSCSCLIYLYEIHCQFWQTLATLNVTISWWY